jgi:protein-glucosylgalactosylhydroxylysine glucosidase
VVFDSDTMKKNAICVWFSILIISLSCGRKISEPDRYEIVNRNNIRNFAFDRETVLSVGNGEFSFGVDITGLQTFPEHYVRRNALKAVAAWNCYLSENSVDCNLGTIGLQVFKENGREITIDDIIDPVQTLNLWTGEIDSRFKIENEPVHLVTVCHPGYDMISVKIISGLIRQNRLRVKFSFLQEVSVAAGYPVTNSTRIISDSKNVVILGRRLKNKDYTILIWPNGAAIKEVSRDLYYLETARIDSVYSFSFQFLNDPANGRVQNFGETDAASKKSWKKFWNSVSPAVFKNGLADREFERSVIRSQYFKRIKVSGLK